MAHIDYNKTHSSTLKKDTILSCKAYYNERLALDNKEKCKRKLQKISYKFTLFNKNA